MVGIARPVYVYKPRPDSNAELRARMLEIAQQRPRFGQPRLHIMLRREGWKINLKRTERLYRQKNLKKRRRKRSGLRIVRALAMVDGFEI